MSELINEYSQSMRVYIEDTDIDEVIESYLIQQAYIAGIPRVCVLTNLENELVGEL